MSEARKIQDWWAKNPMTYGSEHGKTAYGSMEVAFGSREMFDQIDRKFYEWNTPLHGERPFSKIFPYERYGQGHKVLEVGCGLGTMAMLWAQAGAEVTAIDLNPTSIEQTTRRFKILGLKGNIREGDARALELPSHGFDYVYSWGVLHHSPDLRASVKELMRTLKPGGGFGVMLYNRHSLLHWYATMYLQGFLHLEDRFLNPVELASRYGDGGRAEGNPHTWPVTKTEMLDMFTPYARDAKVKVLGTDLDYVLRLALPGLSKKLPMAVIKSWARRFGWSLWISGTKDNA